MINKIHNRIRSSETLHRVALGFSSLIPDYNESLAQYNEVLSQDIFGHKQLPIGLAAGFDKNAVTGVNMFRLGFGFVEFGTVTRLPMKGNKKPRLFRLPDDGAIINRMGFCNKGVEYVSGKLANIVDVKKDNQIVGVNIGVDKGGALEDYIQCFQVVNRFADYVVINISSPNTPNLRDKQNVDTIKRLLGMFNEYKSKNSITCPVLIKLSPDVYKDSIQDIVKSLCGCDGLVLTNTTTDRHGTGNITDGGLSGAPLFGRSTAVLKEFAYCIKGSMPLIGVGGVGNVEHAYKKIRCGASLVQLYTSLTYNRLSFVRDMNIGLAERLLADGFSNISEAIGEDL